MVENHLKKNFCVYLLKKERRQLLSQQAEQLKTHYEDTTTERSDWQTGEFIDESEARRNMDCKS